MNDTDRLRDFVAVYNHKSFRIAADRLGISQSSVTKRIQHLEQSLGVRLFNRTTRSVEPTDTARHLYAFAESALHATGAFLQEAQLLAGGDTGSIRVGAIALAAETAVAASLARLSRSHPRLEVDVVVGSPDVYQDVATGKCDVVIGDQANFDSSPHAPSLRVRTVYEDELVFVHAAKHPAAGTRSISTLLNYPLAIPSRYFNENRLFAALAKQKDPTPAPQYRLNSLSACMRLAATSDVVTLAPSVLLQTDQPTYGLTTARFATGINYTLVLATLARNEPTQAVRAFEQAVMVSAQR